MGFGKIPLGFKIWFGIVIVLMVGMAYWNYTVYQDCLDHGIPKYVCAQSWNHNSAMLTVVSN